MGNSAKVARERLFKLTFTDWLGRVDEILQLRELSVLDFPDMPFDHFHTIGLKAGHVADVIIGKVEEAKARATGMMH